MFANDLKQDNFNNVAAVLMDGNFLALDSVIPDQATVDVFTPLAGGVVRTIDGPWRRPSPHPYGSSSL